MDAMNQLIKTLRENPPQKIAEVAVTGIDDYLTSRSDDLRTQKSTVIHLPVSDVLRFWLGDGSKLVIRPSGTEPKVKIYAETMQKSDDVERAIQTCDERLCSLVASFRKICEV
jgi:phosphomannomutase